MKIVVFPRLLRLVVIAALIAGCSSHPDRDRADRPENPFKTNRDGPGGPKAPKSDKELRLEADQLYRRASTALADNDYSTAIERYNQLIARYPFSDYSTQAELEKIYAQYRNYQPDEAISGADRFLREHPRHPDADYVQYLKGLTNSARDEAFTDFLPLDSTKKDVTNTRRAYDDFALLIQRYPNSRYDGDARRRMIYLRNRVADHELSIVKFYVKRGAFVAASKRAENIIAEYPGAPATAEALKLLEQSQRKIGLNTEADETAKLIAANQAVFIAAAAKPERKSKKIPTVVATTTEPPAAPPPTLAESPPHRSLLARIVGAFDFLDTSKPENTYTLVIPSGHATAAADSATAPAAGGTSTAGSTAAASGTAATAAAGGSTQGKTGYLKATIDYGDSDSVAAPKAAATPAPAPATTTGNLKIDPALAAVPASAAATKDSTATPPTQAPPPEAQKKPSLLERFVNLFSFLDPNRNGSEKPAVPPASGDTKVDNTGATVPASTPDK
jgi:outer membrane protein assembly factor BamD